MEALCKELNPRADQNLIDKWKLVGLLHDADYEITKQEPNRHTLVLEEKIGNLLPPDVMYAIKAHNYKMTGATPKSLMDWSIVSCDELSGLIIAAALVHPDKKLSSLTTDFILKRFNQKDFAKGADRDQIRACEANLHIPLPQFVELSLAAMQKISPYLGL